MKQPLLDRVLIRRINEAPDPDASIVIPEAYRQQSRKGVVVALGQLVVLGVSTFPMSNFLSVGDEVYFGEYNAEPVSIDGEELLIVRIQDIRFKETPDVSQPS